jgi:hypothetical protein
LGFQGLQNGYANVEIPHKKPKGGHLTDEQKFDDRSMLTASGLWNFYLIAA